ncbi:protein arginine N-methyltransferase 1-like [Eupeodes corollae]|uniref:protein arginine N-methyltransferase 1-like n=1 Tax=Eupeodes corollae TaxID=290404 RepID=UPI002491AF75|nr:protein arginine N-methyltransferase 1-like [Eupeodes corollae]
MNNFNKKSKGPSVEHMTSKDFQIDSYAHLDVFSHLIKDTVRTNSFREVIYRNKHLFKDKIVLEVGCGIGLLSLFAAKAGAAKVIAVDCSKAALYARQVALDNKFGDVIKVIHGRIQDVDLQIDLKSVDIIISDWMGYCLFYQSIIDAIIFARDKWLKPDGLIFPDRAKLHISAIEDQFRKNDKINWWRNVHGFNMKAIRKFAICEPRFCAVVPDQVVTSSHLLKDIDLNTITVKDLTFLSPFLIEGKRSGHIDAIMTYFNVIFSKSHTRFGFNTAPWSPSTHWMQSVFYFDEPINIQNGQTFFGAFALKPIGGSMDHIDYCIEILTGEPLQIVGDINCTSKRRGLNESSANSKKIDKKKKT